jgi:hypothetical protein
MNIREYKASDLEALKRMHAEQGIDYNFPDLADEMFVSKLVVENGAGEIEQASLLRLTSEAYLLMDKKAGTPQTRWEKLRLLHEMTRREAKRLGLFDVHAFVPGELPEAFFRRLRRMGWTEEKWRCMWRKVED